MSILQTIVQHKKSELARLPDQVVDAALLRASLQQAGPRRGFAAALRRPRSGPVALVAEIKKASPSAGVIRPDFDPVQIARAYEAGGASCLSVLTEERFFQGSPSFLRSIRPTVSLPLLRKDFIIDQRQILQALQWGADAILLIVAILSDKQLQDYLVLAESAGLDALVEVHDESELDRALQAGAQIIGVNNRDLRTFRVDLATTERLAGKLRAVLGDRAPLLVAESGIQTHGDVQRLARAGAQAILVGESLMREPNIQAKVVELLEGV